MLQQCNFKGCPQRPGQVFPKESSKPHPSNPDSRPSQSPDGLQMKTGTCWRFQYGKQCDGTCAWPDTHHCYKCGGSHATKFCEGQNPKGPRDTAQVKEGANFRQSEPKKEEGASSYTTEPREHGTSSKKEKTDREREEWSSKR